MRRGWGGESLASSFGRTRVPNTQSFFLVSAIFERPGDGRQARPSKKAMKSWRLLLAFCHLRPQGRIYFLGMGQGGSKVWKPSFRRPVTPKLGIRALFGIFFFADDRTSIEGPCFFR